MIKRDKNNELKNNKLDDFIRGREKIISKNYTFVIVSSRTEERMEGIQYSGTGIY